MPRALSGIQPTNILHIGNYLGAIKNWLDLQNNYDCLFCIVDLHAMTVKNDPKTFSQNIINMAKIYLASGIDPAKSIIFQQSKIAGHSELSWILNTITKMSELERMTQYKDKSKQHTENINIGLFSYPVLMAADILLYDTEIVPVGEDQTQHIELARTLAERFNHTFGDTFIVPKGLIKKEGARIMGLDDPTKKMSKSSPTPNSYITLLDDPEIAKKKIMRAVTDSDNEIRFLDDKPAVSNLLTIYSLLSNQKISAIENKYIGSGYGDFKKDLANVVSEFLSEFKIKFDNVKDDDVKIILEEGAKKAKIISEKKIQQVHERVGILLK